MRTEFARLADGGECGNSSANVSDALELIELAEADGDARWPPKATASLHSSGRGGQAPRDQKPAIRGGRRQLLPTLN